MSKLSLVIALLATACGGNDPANEPASGGIGGTAGTGGGGTGGSGAIGGGGPCAEIEGALPSALTSASTPGALVALESSDVSCRAAAGLADRASQSAAFPEQAYLIGSSTKTFVTAAILALHREGLLTDDNDRVEDWLPGLVPNGANITIGHLLTHTSGLPNYTEVMKQLAVDATKPTTPQALVEMALTQPASFAPGERFEYCNTGFTLLGMIIEKASGEPWGEVVRSRFLEPLGLQHTYIDQTELPAGTAMLHSYATFEGAEIDTTSLAHPSWFGAAGSMVSGLDDMTRWTKALYGGDLFEPAYMELLLEPTVTISEESKIYYSLGTIIQETPFGRWIGHGGTAAGTLSYMGSIPESGIVVQAVVTHDSADRFVIADVAWEAALGSGLGDLAPFVSH